MAYIYALQAENGLTKIGKSTSPLLRTMSPVRLDLILCWQYSHIAYANKIERFIHRKLDHCRTHGEWFSTTLEEILAALAQCPAPINRVDLTSIAAHLDLLAQTTPQPEVPHTKMYQDLLAQIRTAELIKRLPSKYNHDGN